MQPVETVTLPVAFLNKTSNNKNMNASEINRIYRREKMANQRNRKRTRNMLRDNATNNKRGK